MWLIPNPTFFQLHAIAFGYTVQYQSLIFKGHLKLHPFYEAFFECLLLFSRKAMGLRVRQTWFECPVLSLIDHLALGDSFNL